MTAHHRRPGFRLPWSSEAAAEQSATGPDAQSETSPSHATSSDTSAPAAAGPAAASPDSGASESPARTAAARGGTEETAAAPAGESGDDAGSAAAATSDPPPAGEPADDTTDASTVPSEPAPTAGFLGDLVAAMRRVADEARDSTLADLRTRVDEAIQAREGDAERRRNDLRARAETDIAGVGEWAKAEAERIKSEAEQRVAARRAQLDQQLAEESSYEESRAESLRSRVTAYEAELQTFHAQLATITDPGAFAAAAKRMPPPPSLDGPQTAAPAASPEPEPQGDAPTETQPETRAGSEPYPADGGDAQERDAETEATNGAAPAAPVADSAADLDELDASAPAAATATEPETFAEPVATEIVVKGLGSFGAITGFRQQLANVEGIDAVGLSLGTSGEFVFRATHRPSLDMAAAVAALEGDAVEIEPRPEGGLRVTLGRPR